MVYYRSVEFDPEGYAWVNVPDGFLKIKDGRTTEIPCEEMYGGKPMNYYYPVPNPDTGGNRMVALPMTPCEIHQDVESVQADRDGLIWITMWKYFPDLVFYGNDKVGWKYYRFTGNVLKLAVDKQGVVWVIFHTEADGYKMTRLVNGVWRPISMPIVKDRRPWINALVFDSNNSPWLDMDDGIFVYKNGGWEKLSTPDVGDVKDCYSDTIHIFAVRVPDEIWGRRGSCIIHWNGSEWEKYLSIPSLPRDSVMPVWDQQGRIWTSSGFVWKGDNYYFDLYEMYAVNDVAVAPDNSIWFTAASNLLIYDNRESQ